METHVLSFGIVEMEMLQNVKVMVTTEDGIGVCGCGGFRAVLCIYHWF